jgi:hypothetical protein
MPSPPLTGRSPAYPTRNLLSGMVGSSATTPHPPRRPALPWLNSHTMRSTCSPDPVRQSCAPAPPQGACFTSSDPTPAANGAQKPAATAHGPHATTDESAPHAMKAPRPPSLAVETCRSRARRVSRKAAYGKHRGRCAVSHPAGAAVEDLKRRRSRCRTTALEQSGGRPARHGVRRVTAGGSPDSLRSGSVTSRRNRWVAARRRRSCCSRRPTGGSRQTQRDRRQSTRRIG